MRDSVISLRFTEEVDVVKDEPAFVALGAAAGGLLGVGRGVRHLLAHQRAVVALVATYDELNLNRLSN